MIKLASMAVLGFALVAMGCQAASPRPPEAPPQAGAMPAPSHPARPDTMRRPQQGPGGPMAGVEAREHKKGRGGDRMLRGERRGDRAMRGAQGRGAGKKMGRQGAGMHPGAMRGDSGAMAELAALGVRFYPPPMLIRRAQEIGLTPDQLTKIRQEMLNSKSKAVDFHAKVEHAKVEAARLLTVDKVDERALSVQIDEAAKAQAEMHKLHLGTMLRVRALLTPEQRQKLDAPKARRPDAKAPGALGQTSSVADDDDDDDDDGEDDDDDDDAES